MTRFAYQRKGKWCCAVLFGLVALGMLIASATAMFELPRTYRALTERGVQTLAIVHDCGRDDCALTYTFAGRRHTSDYGHDLSQFCGGRCAAPTPVLVDPDDPATMYTVHDVQRGTNAGIGVYSLATLLFGLCFAGGAIAMLIAARNTPSRPPPLPPLAADASATARSLDATDKLQDLLDQARPLPGETWYRVDEGELAAGVDNLRGSLTQLAGPKAHALELADRLGREVRDAPRIPLVGGIRVRAWELAEQLDEIRMAIVSSARATARG